MEEAETLLRSSVKLAVEARDKFWEETKRNPLQNRNKALVAASIGSYGAYLADGSEYRYVNCSLYIKLTLHWFSFKKDFLRYIAVASSLQWELWTSRKFGEA